MDGLKAILIVELLITAAFYLGYIFGNSDGELGIYNPLKNTIGITILSFIITLLVACMGYYG